MNGLSPSIVVTGATGFIGSEVCRQAAARRLRIHAIGRRCPAISGVVVHRVDRYQDMQVPRDAICLHLAGESSLAAFASDAGRAATEALALAGFILEYGFSRVVVASSAVVYGDGVTRPRREDEAEVPAGAYARAKAGVERAVIAAGQVVMRPANVYGAGMAGHNVLSDIVAQLDGTGDLHVRDCTPVRDYVHVRDVARGALDLAMSQVTGAFNLGTGVGTSVAELGQLVMALARVPASRHLIGAAEGPPSHLVLDTTRSFEAIGWRAEITLASGLRELIDNRSVPSQARTGATGTQL